MVFDTISGDSASTSTKFGGTALNKIGNFLNGGGSEIAYIKDDDIVITDPSTTTKRVRIDAGTVSASNTRVLNMPDRDVHSNVFNEVILLACSDETTALTVGTGKVTFRCPFAFYVTGVSASVTTAPVGSTIICDINEAGSTILSTKLSIDASEKTSTSAASAAVISDASIAADAEITVDIDQIGSSTAGAGLKVKLDGYRTA
jgi:hypothetical protein